MRNLLRLLLLIAVSLAALELGFALRVAALRVVDPASTAFQRSEIRRLLASPARLDFRRRWVDWSQISPNAGRAVIASEDSGFVEHHGADWEAIRSAWTRNRASEAAAERRAAAGRNSHPKIVGGSTITQQLAKNLYLSGERSVLRKAQELVIALCLEAFLDKRRILEIYLNSVEWGEGVFGIEAASERYFRIHAARLDPMAAARLAVMLPAPKRFERNPASPYVIGRAATIAARMSAVSMP